jgi:hypothetical protein
LPYLSSNAEVAFLGSRVFFSGRGYFLTHGEGRRGKIWENFPASARYWAFPNVYISRGTWEAGTRWRVARVVPSLGVGHSGVAFAGTQRVDGLRGATEPGGMSCNGATASSKVDGRPLRGCLQMYKFILFSRGLYLRFSGKKELANTLSLVSVRSA